MPGIHIAGVPLHIVRRGHNRDACFFGEEDYLAYCHWLGWELIIVSGSRPRADGGSPKSSRFNIASLGVEGNPAYHELGARVLWGRHFNFFLYSHKSSIKHDPQRGFLAVQV